MPRHKLTEAERARGYQKLLRSSSKHVAGLKAFARKWLREHGYSAAIVLLAVCVLAAPAIAQRSNTVYVDQFTQISPNPTVGQMATAAQNNCNPDTTIPCIVIFDTSLAARSTGTLPARCTQCTWIDFRTANSIVYSGMTAQVFNGVLNVAAFTGADASIKWNACNAAAIALGGGTCDASGLAGNQTLTVELDVGNAAGVPVSFRLPNWGFWTNSTIVDGVSSVVKQFHGSSLIGQNSGEGTPFQFRSGSGAIVDTVYTTDLASSGYYNAYGFGVRGGTGSTVNTAVCQFAKTQDQSSFQNIQCVQNGATGTKVTWIWGTCCRTTFLDISSEANGGAGWVPLTVGNPTVANTAATNFISFSAVHPGNGLNAAIWKTCSTWTGGNTLFGLYMEGVVGGGDTTTPPLAITASCSATAQDTFMGIKLGTDEAGSTKYTVDIASTAKATLHEVSSSNGNCINDHNAGGGTVSCGAANTAIPLYISAGNTVPIFGSGFKASQLTLTNLLLSSTAPTISTHFNTSGDSITANGTGAFKITVGSGTANSTGVLTLPTATNGWWCSLYNQSRGSYIQQTANTTTTATFTNYGTTVGTPVNWTNGDTLVGSCDAI